MERAGYARPMRNALLLILVVGSGCSASDAGAEPNPPAARSPAAAAEKPTMPAGVPEDCKRPGLPQSGLPTGAVVLDTKPSETRLDVELCLTDRTRQIGMMCRTGIDDDKGMLFVFGNMRPRSFWMKNTLIPLDMVFLDDEGRIVGIVEKAAPLTLQSRNVPSPAQYVLEIGAGRAKELGLEPGMWARFEGLPATVPGPAAAAAQKGAQKTGTPASGSSSGASSSAGSHP